MYPLRFYHSRQHRATVDNTIESSPQLSWVKPENRVLVVLQPPEAADHAFRQRKIREGHRFLMSWPACDISDDSIIATSPQSQYVHLVNDTAFRVGVDGIHNPLGGRTW
jgi:hypothetical protein